MRARFLLGPAGSGKSHRCLEEIRAALLAAPEGPPLVLLAPRQMTYQLERQLLADESLSGYTRLQVLSFERLAFWLFEQLDAPEPHLLDAEGRVMVLRALLVRKRSQLKLFRASARLTGFAQELSNALAEFQTHQITADQLQTLATRLGEAPGIAAKLHDFALLLEEYVGWLEQRGLQDAANLLDLLAATLHRAPAQPRIAGLWVDGFAEFAPQEVAVLAALAPHCERATITFCLDREPEEEVSWLSTWAVVRQSFKHCRAALDALPGCQLKVETLTRDLRANRFAGSPPLRHLEAFWPEPKPFPTATGAATVLALDSMRSDCATIRLVECANADAEATFAAREVLRFVREGGRFRDVTVLVRDLESYHGSLRRAFGRYEIPCFMDRRESVAHHPLAELTRSALRTVARDWRHEDWFAALKSGLISADEQAIDRLENEALAHGWQGSPLWLKPLSLTGDSTAVAWAERWRQTLVPPFEQLVSALGGRTGRPRGHELASALRAFWQALDIEAQLEEWAELKSDVGRLTWPADQLGAVHRTVWEQMNTWLENLENAFPDEALPLAEWLPILDAGLGSLTVGVIPPALDQVRIGAVNRSRNPDVQFALVLGLNEGVFPARPSASPLLTDTELDTLAEHGMALSSLPLRQLGREQHFGYVACTRARRQLFFTSARHDAEGKPLNPSPFVSRLQTLFPSLQVEAASGNAGAQCDPASGDPPDAASGTLHVCDLIPQLLALPGWPAGTESLNCSTVESVYAVGDTDDPAIPQFDSLLSSLAPLRRYANLIAQDRLRPDLAEQLYGRTLRTSVSRLEQFAACPFRFFVHAGLRAEERVRFELDDREQGTFQHDVLAAFHEQLRREGKRWRDVTPAEARARVRRIADSLALAFREGLFAVSEQTRFTARLLTGALEDFVEVLVGWMRGQYAFDPVAVELAFGEVDSAPALMLDLGDGHQLALRGRIDRVDLSSTAGGEAALCVVVDYKSSQKELDPVLLANGVQLQLPAYLNVLQHWPDPESVFGVRALRPAGVFYVSLRGQYSRETNRRDALADPDDARRLAYQHAGRFDASALVWLDNRGVPKGDQFNYRRTKDGELMKNCREALSPEDFAALLRNTEASLKRMGREIFAGAAQVDPYRHKSMVACDQCVYQAICRIDSWTHRYRVLKVDRLPEVPS